MKKEPVAQPEVLPEVPKPPAIIAISLDQNTGQIGVAASLPPGKEGLKMALEMIRVVESDLQNQVMDMLGEKDGD